MKQDRAAVMARNLMRTLALTIMLTIMNATMFMIVLPDIARNFQLSKVQVSWVATSYFLVFGVATVIYGKLADSLALKTLLVVGLSLFALGSLSGLLAHAYWMVLLGRIIQALGAAVIPAIAMIIPMRFFPAEKRGQALGIVFSALALGSALGPIVTALIVSVAPWRWLFAVPLLSLLTLPFYLKYLALDHHVRQPVRFDWMGSGLLVTGVTLLLLTVTYGSWRYLLGCLLFLGLFGVQIRTSPTPFIPLTLFKNRGYARYLLIGFIVSALGFSTPFLTPLLLADLYHLEPQYIGFALVPGALVTAILGRSAGKLADHKGNIYLFSWAAVLLISSYLLLATFMGRSPIWVASILIFIQAGQSFSMIALSNTLAQTLVAAQAGVAMGVFQMINFIAGAVAGAAYSKMLEFDASFPLNPIAPSTIWLYSNIYMILALLVGGVLWVYRHKGRY